MKRSENRFIVVDSFRALAALYVVFFHFFYRWAESTTGDSLIPPVPVLSGSQVIAHGYLGVEFFFIISGFVIALTLRRSKSIWDFAVKRFARLFPAMLVCSGFIFAFVNLVPLSPFSDVGWIDFLPSLTFISPSVYNFLFGLDSNWISGVYWSLFVEVKFYFYAACLYFLAPRNLLVNMFVLSSALSGAYFAVNMMEYDFAVLLISVGFFPQYAFLFTGGMAFYELMYSSDRAEPTAKLILGLSALASVVIYAPILNPSGGSVLASVLIAVFFFLFWCFVYKPSLLAPLRQAWLASIGAASYSLYLLHQSIGVTLIYVANSKLGESAIWSLGVLIVVIALSLLSYYLVENPSRVLIRRLVEPRNH